MDFAIGQKGEMMDELITKKSAVSAFTDLLVCKLKGERLPTWNDVYNAINAIPSVQPEPKAGHWIHKHERTPNTWECSNCGYRVNLMDGGIYKFCSACGEKKDGEYG